MQQIFKFKDPISTTALPAMSAKVDYDFPVNPNGMVMIGEAPGAEEVRLGHPFVGRSGQLLDKTLAKADIERKKCLITNVFRMQPPGNKVDHFFISRRAAQQQDIKIAQDLGQFGSAWCRAEFASEIDHLRSTLKEFSQKRRGKLVLIALGRTPFWALTGLNGLLEKIGKPLPCRLLPDLTVIPTFHPSFILRGNWARQEEWLGHFLAAKQYLV